MSGLQSIPTIEFKVNGSAVDVINIISINIHLGCTKEVSNYTVVIDNSNPDTNNNAYSIGQAKVFTKGHSVTFKIKRGTITSNTNYLLTGVLESIEYLNEVEEYRYANVVIIRGRCNGRQLFDRKVNGNLLTLVGTGYKAYKRTSGEGESLIAYLIDNYTSLSHIRETSVATGNAAAAQKVVNVTDGTIFTAGDLVKIYDDVAWEYNKIASIATNALTMTSDLIASYTTAANLTVGLDLIRDTNTSYTKMIYEDETTFDAIKFIADTADTGGIIGYDSRIEYDGKYAFLPRGHVTEPYTLAAQVQAESYLDDSMRIKNRIKVSGKADAPWPVDTDGVVYSDALTETWSQKKVALASNAASGQKDVILTDATGYVGGDIVWLVQTNVMLEFEFEKYTIASIASATLTMTENLATTFTTAKHASCVLSSYTGKKGWFATPLVAWNDVNVGLGTTVTPLEGSNQIEVGMNNARQECHVYFILPDGYERDMSIFHLLAGAFQFPIPPQYAQIKLKSGNCTYNETSVGIKFSGFTANEWGTWAIDLNESVLTGWTEGATFDRTDIKMVEILVWWPSSALHSFYIDRFYWFGGRWGGGNNNAAIDGFAEDTVSQSAGYGIREHNITNDLLLSNASCEAKAQSLLSFYTNPRVSITPDTRSLDMVDYPILPGNKVAIVMTPLGISDTYRIDSVALRISALDNEFSLTFDIENTPARTAEYLFGILDRIKILEKSLSGTIKGQVVAFSPPSGGTTDHGSLTNVTTSQHHVKYTDAEALAAITDSSVSLGAGKIGRTLTPLTLGNGVTTFAVTGEAMEITGDGGANVVATITGGVTGQILILTFVDALVTITDTDAHTADTVDLAGAATDLVSADDTVLQLVFDGTSWYEVSRSVN